MTTLADSSVLLDIFEAGSPFQAWSASQLAHAVNRGPVLINAVVYAETSIRFARKAEFDLILASSQIGQEHIPDDAAFLAGKVFMTYRRRGGPRTSILPDFLIGAHAAVRGYSLLTRDARRYRGYFPSVKLIAP